MIAVSVDSRQLVKQLNSIVAYSEGFLDGAKFSKPEMLRTLGIQLRELVGEFIDSNARVDPKTLHHVYEWYQVGSPAARLFDIDYIVRLGGLTMNGSLTQSKSLAKGSTTPFYNKARIMESGSPVTISPKKAEVLRFEIDGEEIFTRSPVTVNNPGGSDVNGSFASTFRMFFATYASQSLLEISGLADELRKPTEFSKNFAAGAKGGRAVGLSAGRKFITGGKN